MIEHSSNDSIITSPVHDPKEYISHPLNKIYLNTEMKNELFTLIAKKEAFKILKSSSLSTIRKYLQDSN